MVFEPSELTNDVTAERLQADINEFVSLNLQWVQQENKGMRYVEWGMRFVLQVNN